jgi:hypothetical protein
MEEERKSKNAKQKKQSVKQAIFYENPYDIETFFEGMTIAMKHGKEMQYVDRFITHMRLDPLQDTADISFKVLTKDLKLLEYEN